eukprot:TRINITY_DN3176_c1_g2_i2.p1 TRINITY_DN3176_c1_g2~~TRINITY_DN3176_c1_g2_i2.p1  ORF type:complete len:869 (-),score=192.73 TRINITY_DN3176_c1_g2_i2:1420-3714(-)
MDGCKIFMDGFSSQVILEYKEIILNSGGSRSIDSSSATHIIVPDNIENSRLKYLIKSNRSAMIVSLDWLLDCNRSGELIGTEMYTISETNCTGKNIIVGKQKSIFLNKKFLNLATSSRDSIIKLKNLIVISGGIYYSKVDIDIIQEKIDYIVLKHGGTIPDYVIEKNISVNYETITTIWVDCCVKSGRVVSPTKKRIFKPLPLRIKDYRFMRHMYISVAELEKYIKDDIISLLKVLRIKYSTSIDINTSHLICASKNCKYYKQALNMGIIVVQKDWLYSCIENGCIPPAGKFSIMSEKENPFSREGLNPIYFSGSPMPSRIYQSSENIMSSNSSKNMPLKGVVLVICDRMDEPKKSRIVSLASDLGADVRHILNRRVTHYVTDENRYIREKLSDKVKIISPDWVEACHEKRELVNEYMFPHTRCGNALDIVSIRSSKNRKSKRKRDDGVIPHRDPKRKKRSNSTTNINLKKKVKISNRSKSSLELSQDVSFYSERSGIKPAKIQHGKTIIPTLLNRNTRNMGNSQFVAPNDFQQVDTSFDSSPVKIEESLMDGSEEISVPGSFMGEMNIQSQYPILKDAEIEDQNQMFDDISDLLGGLPSQIDSNRDISKTEWKVRNIPKAKLISRTEDRSNEMDIETEFDVCTQVVSYSDTDNNNCGNIQLSNNEEVVLLDFLRAAKPPTEPHQKKHFQISQFSGEDANRIKYLIRELGGVYINEKEVDKKCTHVISQDFHCSEKVLCAFASGLWMLRGDYVYDSAKKRILGK